MKHAINFYPSGDEKQDVFHGYEGTETKIGEVIASTLITWRDPAKHIYRKYNAYSFNCKLIESGKFDVVVIVQEKPAPELVISVDEIKQCRVEMNGDEEQYFVPLEKFTRTT